MASSSRRRWRCGSRVTCSARSRWRAGAGLAQTYQFAVARELARGELVEVLAHERGASRSFSLLYPRGVVQTPAVKKLVAFLVAEARRADVR